MHESGPGSWAFPKKAGWARVIRVTGWVLGLLLVVLGLAGPLMLWPHTDEANYILQARHIADGLLPYRDFYDFVTPGSQLAGAIFIKLNGDFSVVGLRLLVLMGWLVEILLICDMARHHLPRRWLWVLAAFLWLTMSRYPVFQHHFWSGFWALLAVYCAWRYLRGNYAAKPDARLLAASGMLAAATFWTTQSLGVLLAGALLAFSALHSILHEREERGVSFRQVSNRAVWTRWRKSWGRWWLLPMLGFHVACIGVLLALGIADVFWRDAIQWLWAGHYRNTTVIGYYTTFHAEFLDTIRPLTDGVPMPWAMLFWLRVPIALHVFLIGLLPVLGILTVGYLLPGRFLYRLLRFEDESLLLWWLAATAMILSTFSYSTSMHIVSNGALAYLLAGLAIHHLAQRRAAAHKLLGWATPLFLALLLLGAAAFSWVQLQFGTWLPRFKALPESLLYTLNDTSPQDFVAVIHYLDQAEAQGEPVYIFNETPSLYLPGRYRNATRFTLTIPRYNSPAQMGEILRDLETNPPLYVVNDQAARFLHRDPRFSRYRPEQLRLPGLERFLSGNYAVAARLGRYVVYRRLTPGS